MKKTLFALLVLALIVHSCKKKEPVDIVVINANVYTVNNAFEKAEAFAVKDGKFVAIGTSDEIGERFSATEIIDANGKTIIPGFIDAHCHFYGLGMNQQYADLRDTKSFDEIVEKLLAFQQEKEQSVILGRGWDQNDWEVKTFPDKEKLDKLFPDTPVVLERIDGHAYLVNQKMLDMAGITGETEADDGEVVLKDGKPTGVLVDGPMSLVDAILPPPDKEMQINALKDAQQICFGYGLTTVNDAGLSRETIELIDSLQRMNTLDIRIYAMVRNSEKDVNYYLSRGIQKTDKLDVRSIKVYADGALGSRGAALKTPYSDQDGHYGAMVTPVKNIEALAKKIAASDYQMNTHAIGDSANVAVLRAYAGALNGKKDRRWKIEHAQIISPEDFDCFEQGIIPSVQPTHATSDMYWAGDRLGEQRLKGGYAYKTLLNKAGVIALGTDFPVEHVNPFYTFYAAVARKDLEGYPDKGFQPEDALSREEALRGMTIWAAYSNFEEDEKGSIAPGKFADFIVLDKDIMEASLEEIPGMKVERTFVGGKKVY
ncbi:amidohydrolase [Sinomicrobium weinanense]|uniref:Amidohydrolase n=1 Tax=Sinomicrobium weinanense TaxID=2842200 RepID=A0A926JS77_9FLAO|nr:amidohydrolase [Sinomicrobium weinanense]MBC9796308.1 amidohydrolase [Sinomicrobium weinanense]MBU3123211.1 amidohydrolase [Sinomicrobium weinanense]